MEPAALARAQMRHTPLGFGMKIGFAGGQLVEGVVNNTMSVFQLFYVTAVCGLAGGLAGLALSVGLILDAVMDPLIGSMSDRWRSRFGRRLPFMAVGLIPITLAFVLAFALPTGLGQVGLAVWLGALTATMRIGMSLYVLPLGAVSAEITDDPLERSSLMSWRWAIGQIGALVVMILGFGVFLGGKGGLTNRSAYLPFALTLAVLFVLGALSAMRVTYATRDRQHVAATHAGGQGANLFREMWEVMRNPSFRILFAGALLFFVSIGVYAALAIHANTFFWRLKAGETQVVTLALFGGLLLGAPLAGPLLARFEKSHILTAGMFGLGLAQGLPFLLRFAGVLTLTGPALTLFIAAILLVAGMMMAAAAIAFMSMLADAADEHEFLFGARREGLYFAGWSFATKAASGLGALIAGSVLQFIGFPTDLAQHGGMTAVLPEHMTHMLALFTGPGAGLLAVLAALINLGYRLDGRRHAEILAALETRRATP